MTAKTLPQPVPEDLTVRFGEAVSLATDGTWEIQLPAEAAREALEYLGRDRQPVFDYLLDLCGVDYPESFEVVYHLSRPTTAEVVRVRVQLPRRGAKIETVTDLWAGAGWPERELMEMFGIAVEGNPDPRHLLLPEDWKGFPLRKDYQYPQDHPYLRRDPMHEDPGAFVAGKTPASETNPDEEPTPEAQ